MALDGIFLSLLKRELEDSLLGARVDRIHQPSNEELVIAFRSSRGTGRLLLCASAMSARIHLCSDTVENPRTPPAFCMLLRKRLAGAKLTAIRQNGFERVLLFDFETKNELLDTVTVTVSAEIMGRHSNIIVFGENGKIIDSIKRVDFSASSVRQVLPGMTYTPPPAQDKLSVLEYGSRNLAVKILSRGDRELSRSVMDTVEGISPVIASEIASYALRSASQTEDVTLDRLAFKISELQRIASGSGAVPTMICDKDRLPKDIAFMPVRQYGTERITAEYPDFSSLLENFYHRKSEAERLRQRSGDLLQLLSRLSDRISRRVAAQKQELMQSCERGQLKQKGDLLAANIYAFKKGDTSVTVSDFYSDPPEDVTISLDARLTPSQNINRYYTEYRKADTAEKKLRELIASGEEELVYLDSVFDCLVRSSSYDELTAIREELASAGYVKDQHRKDRKPAKLSFLAYRTSDGFTVRCGRSNIQNDRLTLKESRPGDIWLHVQAAPGSHTVISSGGRTVPDSTIEQAAVIAACNSRARSSGKTAVDYTDVRYVKKPSGAKPGMVIYTDYRTVLVSPDEELERSLKIKE